MELLAVNGTEIAQYLAPTLITVALGALAFCAKWLTQLRKDTGEIKAHLQLLNGRVGRIETADAKQNERLAYLEGQAGMALGSTRQEKSLGGAP